MEYRKGSVTEKLDPGELDSIVNDILSKGSRQSLPDLSGYRNNCQEYVLESNNKYFKKP
jgi:hypothetical protein